MVVPAEANAECLLARACVCCPALECSQSGDLFYLVIQTQVTQKGADS